MVMTVVVGVNTGRLGGLASEPFPANTTRETPDRDRQFDCQPQDQTCDQWPCHLMHLAPLLCLQPEGSFRAEDDGR